MNNEFSNILFPIAQRVAATTIGQNLVSVKPMGYIDEEKVEEIENRIKVENRDKYIDSILNSTKFEFKTLEDDREYKELLNEGLPKGELMYLDYTYDNKNNK